MDVARGKRPPDARCACHPAPPTSAPDPVADRVARLAQLEAVNVRLIGAVEARPSPDRMVDTRWTSRDVVGHLAFGHESFARNVGDLGHGRVPTPTSRSCVTMSPCARAGSTAPDIEGPGWRLGDNPDHPRYIQTERGLGYRFIAGGA